VGTDMIDKIERILTLVDRAEPPGWSRSARHGLSPLKGDLKGFYAVTVRANWRLIYRFENGNPKML
jgi:proteic killer suppression protein